MLARERSKGLQKCKLSTIDVPERIILFTFFNLSISNALRSAVNTVPRLLAHKASREHMMSTARKLPSTYRFHRGRLQGNGLIISVKNVFFLYAIYCRHPWREKMPHKKKHTKLFNQLSLCIFGVMLAPMFATSY